MCGTSEKNFNSTQAISPAESKNSRFPLTLPPFFIY